MVLVYVRGLFPEHTSTGGVAHSQVAITTFSGLYLADFSVEGQQPGALLHHLLTSRWPPQAA